VCFSSFSSPERVLFKKSDSRFFLVSYSLAPLARSIPHCVLRATVYVDVDNSPPSLSHTSKIFTVQNFFFPFAVASFFLDLPRSFLTEVTVEFFSDDLPSRSHFSIKGVFDLLSLYRDPGFFPLFFGRKVSLISFSHSIFSFLLPSAFRNHSFVRWHRGSTSYRNRFFFPTSRSTTPLFFFLGDSPSFSP